MSSSLHFDLDSQITDLELEWRQAYDASIVARAESKKALVLMRIERLEDNMLGQG
jgi:hypothetical protein